MHHGGNTRNVDHLLGKEIVVPQLYELVVQASGVVRDKDGNILSSQPIEMRTTVEEGSEGHALAQAFLTQYAATTDEGETE